MVVPLSASPMRCNRLRTHGSPSCNIPTDADPLGAGIQPCERANGERSPVRTASRFTSCFAALIAILLPLGTSSAGIVEPNVDIATSAIIENEPDVAESQGRMVAVWYRGSYEDAVGWGFSMDGGATWSLGGGLPHNPDAP